MYKYRYSLVKFQNIELTDDIDTRKNHIRKNFRNKKFNNNFKKRKFGKKFGHFQKDKKSTFENKKPVNY